VSLVIGLTGAVLTLLSLGLIVRQSVLLAAFLSLLMAASTVILLVVTWRPCHEKYHRDLKAREAERAKLERRLESVLCATCSEESHLAARYGGWHGTVHTFYFSSDHFAAALERANPGKCLKGG
jgi:hypothetical protein